MLLLNHKGRASATRWPDGDVHATSTGHVPGVVVVPTVHDHDTVLVEPALFGVSPWAPLGPLAYVTVIVQFEAAVVVASARAVEPRRTGFVTVSWTECGGGGAAVGAGGGAGVGATVGWGVAGALVGRAAVGAVVGRGEVVFRGVAVLEGEVASQSHDEGQGHPPTALSCGSPCRPHQAA